MVYGNPNNNVVTNENKLLYTGIGFTPYEALQDFISKIKNFKTEKNPTS